VPPHERLKLVLADVFERDPADVPDDASSTTVEGWDSLRHLELMLAVEAEFGVRIPTGEMRELTSLQSIDDYLKSHALDP
jgi:acyl carrier protein